jgi:hypothetical protein
MKVLDLMCANRHRFEGWFASEDDFSGQLQRALLQCPVCGDAAIVKCPSAPRLNFGCTREPDRAEQTPSEQPAGLALEQSQRAAWLTLARRLVAQADDVGTGFVEEARRMHYAETDRRAIRGQARLDEALELLEEGIDVLPLPDWVVREEPLH